MPKIIETRSHASAEEFLTALGSLHPFWGNTGGIDRWIFRGHSDATWELNPTAMRPNCFVRYALGIKASHTPRTLSEQLESENEAVFDFISQCLGANLPIPEDSQWLRNISLQKAAFGEEHLKTLDDGIDVPFALYRSLYALAQHHGVLRGFLTGR